jgi:hypothetical protein
MGPFGLAWIEVQQQQSVILRASGSHDYNRSRPESRVPKIQEMARLSSSTVNTLPIAKSQIRSEQNKDMHKCT